MTPQIRKRMDTAYTDKLDGEIPEDFGAGKWMSGGQKSKKYRWSYRPSFVEAKRKS
jgi:hypothetical protein